MMGAILPTFIACQSIPKDAPQSFHDAKNAIDDASDKKVGKYFPNTLKQAKLNYDSAVDFYEQAKSEDYTNEQRTKAMLASQQQLDSIEELLNVTTKYTSKVTEIDQFVPKKGSLELASNQINRFTQQLAAFEPTKKKKDTLVVSDIKLSYETSDFEIKGPVAFFAFAQTKVVNNFQEPINDLVAFAENNPSARIHLIGYADPRGSSSYNYRLALTRAKNVAKILIDKGIDASRIQLSSEGSVNDANMLEGKGHYQLNRRVEAVISV